MAVEDDLKLLYPKEYIHAYLASDLIGNPLRPVVPCFTDDRPAHYPLTFNALIFNIPVVDGGLAWDASIEDCKAKLVEVYPQYGHYELHIYLQADAPAIEAGGSQVTTSDTLLTALALELGDYGVYYHGKVALAAIEVDIKERVKTFYEGTN